MKKKYIKPEVRFENLSFNTAIASCDYIYSTSCGNTSIENFGRPFEDSEDPGTIYITTPGVCNTEKYCYHMPYELFPTSDKFANS